VARPLDQPWMGDIGPEVPWVGRAAALMLRALGRTWDYSVTGGEHERAAHAGGSRVIYALWHGRLLPLVFLYRGRPVGTLVSRHRDGEYLAHALELLGYTVRRGSSRRGGPAALLSLLELSRSVDLAITPDGPRGPAGQVSGGILMLAQRTGLPILPVGCRAPGAWHFGSWDRFMIPRPFSRVEVRFGEPLRVPQDLDAGAMSAAGRRLQDVLARLSDGS
jgi:lysophospholipid acyltransferase (LPLAT)-like uncharacterized protein